MPLDLSTHPLVGRHSSLSAEHSGGLGRGEGRESRRRKTGWLFISTQRLLVWGENCWLGVHTSVDKGPIYRVPAGGLGGSGVCRPLTTLHPALHILCVYLFFLIHIRLCTKDDAGRVSFFQRCASAADSSAAAAAAMEPFIKRQHRPCL